MKTQVAQILGKTISGVMFKKNKEFGAMPAEQMFLLFDDGTAYEFYCTGILNTTGGLINTDINGLYQYMKSNMDVYFQSIKDPDSDQHITGYINLNSY